MWSSCLLLAALLVSCDAAQRRFAPPRVGTLPQGAERSSQRQRTTQLATTVNQPARSNLRNKQLPARLIPKILHQTYKSGNTTSHIDLLMRSWKVRNPGWEARFYDDGACLRLVSEHFPEYMATYVGLKKNVERADFFRYMVVLAHGGVYSDVDTESLIPLDDILQPEDALVAGWEDEHSTVQAAMNAKFSRQRQALQWMLVGRPGHAALRELCDRIVANAERDFHTNPNTATLLRTGPGVFTDVVLKYALSYPLGHKDAVRILPKVSFGGMSRWQSGLNPEEEPGRAVVHYDQGSWKAGLTPPLLGAKEIMGPLEEADMFAETEVAQAGGQQSGVGGGSLAVDQSAKVLKYEGLPGNITGAKDLLFPVSMLQAPPFTMMLHLAGHGDEQAGFDVAAQLTTWGNWVPPGILPLQPGIAEVLFQAWKFPLASGKVFLDIGAGLGFFTLAAAAMGIHTLAFELGPKSLASFQASVRYNGFHDRISLVKAALGNAEEEICLDPLVSRSPSQLSVDIERGYGNPRLHALTAKCVRSTLRRQAADLVANDQAIGAVRISASGWEGWIIDGLQPVIGKWKPHSILIELYPELLESTGYIGRAIGMIQRLQAFGYLNVTHIGPVCVRSRILAAEAQGQGMSQQDALRQPGWCNFGISVFSEAFQEENMPLGTPELLLFSTTSSGLGNIS